MTRSSLRTLLFLLIGVGLLAGCGTPPTPLPTAAPTATPRPVTLTPTATPEPTTAPTNTPLPAPTSTPEPTSTVAPTASPSLELTATFTPLPPAFDPTPPPPVDPAADDFEDQLRAYVQLVADMLNAGYSFEEVLDTLAAWSMPEGAQERDANIWHVMQDVDGDGTEEGVVSLPLPGIGCGATFCPRTVVVLERSGDRFSPGTIIPSDAGMLMLGSPMLRFTEDINADGQTEIVLEEQSCGAHTCFTLLIIGHWDGTTWYDLTADPIDQAYADLTIEDRDDDGILEFAMTGGTSGSAGAGLQRRHTLIFDWQDGAYRRVEDIPSPSDHPYYLMVDANAALADEDDSRALDLAMQAIENPTFEETMAPVEPLDKARILSYAAVEAMLAHALSGDLEAMEVVLERARSMPEVTENVYLDAAQALLDVYRETDDPVSACAAMEDLIVEQAEPPVFFQWYGYGTERLRVDQVCPLDASAEGETPQL